MFSLEILLLGVALAIDAAIVAFAISLLHRQDSRRKKVVWGLIVAGLFGLFQFLMLWFGSYCGYLFTFSSYGYFFQLGSGFIFISLAIKCFHESVSLEAKKIEWSITPFFILAFVTSIDAYVSGLSMGTLPRPLLAGLEVGIITFGVCGAFYFLGQFFRDIPDRWLLRGASFIFLVLGTQIIWTFRGLLLRG